MSAPAAAPAADLKRLQAETIRRLCAVPEPLTVTEWADKYRMLPETSTAPGPYDSAVAPYVRRPQDLLGDPDVTTLVLCWAAQTLKSTTLENAIGYRIHRAPSPLLVVQPKIDAAESWAKERLVPMIVATPVLRERVRLGRSSDSTLRYKRFAGGFVFVPSAQSATELASRSAAFVLCDEVDRYETIPGEGNPVEIVARRQGAADVGLLALTSTPRDAETTTIWPYLEGGTYELYHVPCPHCGTTQPLVWAGLKWDKGEPGTAQYLCGAGLPPEVDAEGREAPAGCGAMIDERHKAWMLDPANGADWVATNPGAPYPSFHLNALYSPFAKSGWRVLVGEWLRAQGKPADLQVFVNTRLAELWAETGEEVAGDAIISRLTPHEQGVVPDGVGALTLGGDIQHNRIEAYLWGWGVGLESWLVDAAIFLGDPTREPDQPGSVWAALWEWALRLRPHAAGGPRGAPTVRVSAALIDSGYAMSQVYRFTRRRAGYRFFASKGVGGGGVPILGKPTLQTKDRVALYPVGVDAAKTEFLRSQLGERAAGPGFVHFPDWLTSDQCDQFVAERRFRRVHRGKVTYEWRKKRDDLPNEALDCRVYARAALEILGARTIAGLGTLAAQLAEQARAGGGAAAAPARRVRRVRSPGIEV